MNKAILHSCNRCIFNDNCIVINYGTIKDCVVCPCKDCFINIMCTNQCHDKEVYAYKFKNIRSERLMKKLNEMELESNKYFIFLIK